MSNFPSFPLQPPEPQPDMDERFLRIARKAARTFRMSQPPWPDTVEGNRHMKELDYLPIDEVTEEKFNPHGWVITAMWRAHDLGMQKQDRTQDKQLAELVIKHEEELRKLRNQLERYETIDRIRRYLDDADCRSTEDVMQLVYKLSDMR